MLPARDAGIGPFSEMARDTPEAQLPSAGLRDRTALRRNIGWERQRPLSFTTRVASGSLVARNNDADPDAAQGNRCNLRKDLSAVLPVARNGKLWRVRFSDVSRHLMRPSPGEPANGCGCGFRFNRIGVPDRTYEL